MFDTASYAAYRKSPRRSIKHSTYFETYDGLFARYRGQPITFVEVGVLGGGSLFMWREFFGEQARIIGIDLNPQAKKWEQDGFEIFIGSQSDQSFWSDLVAKVGPIDVLLDDGGHTFEQQIVTVEAVLANIKDGGMVVVEDTHTSYQSGFGPRRYSFMAYVSHLADRLTHRFHELGGRGEERVWSIQIFESIVAFHVNRVASQRISEQTDNGGADDQAADHRYADNTFIARLGDIYRSSRVLQLLPGIDSLATWVHGVAAYARGLAALKRFFR